MICYLQQSSFAVISVQIPILIMILPCVSAAGLTIPSLTNSGQFTADGMVTMSTLCWAFETFQLAFCTIYKWSACNWCISFPHKSSKHDGYSRLVLKAGWLKFSAYQFVTFDVSDTWSLRVLAGKVSQAGGHTLVEQRPRNSIFLSVWYWRPLRKLNTPLVASKRSSWYREQHQI